jgi:CheY-like chemotaxis protein
MDLQMPEMDGYGATAAIRGELGLHSLPVLALTAHAMAEEKRRCHEAGMNGHIAKPIDPDVLLENLAKWGGRPAIQRAPEAGPALQEIEGVDTKAALRRVGGNTTLYHQLLAQFVTGHGDAPARLAAHLAAGERIDAQRIAHSIRGVAGNIGATALTDVARQLEKAIASGQEDGTLLQRFSNLTAATIAVLDKALPVPVQAATENTEPAAPAEGDLQKLIDYLAGGDMEAIDYFAAHRSGLHAVLGQSLASVEAINDFDFGAALDQLNLATSQADIALRREE